MFSNYCHFLSWGYYSSLFPDNTRMFLHYEIILFLIEDVILFTSKVTFLSVVVSTT